MKMKTIYLEEKKNPNFPKEIISFWSGLHDKEFQYC